jgi:hypothetical protein
MGYPMSYARLVCRNNLRGDYNAITDMESCNVHCIRGDLRRFEADSRDEEHLKMYAEKAGITVEQARIVLDALFDDGGQPFK